MASKGLQQEFNQNLPDTEIDPLTGLCLSESLLLHVHEHCKGTAANSYIVVGDFVNLSGLNEVLENGPANDVFRTVVSYYQDELRVLDSSALVGFREHGDSIIFVIEGDDLGENDVAAALHRAADKSQDFVREIGLDKLQHPRHKNVTGTGLTTAFASINRFSESLLDSKNELAFQLSSERSMMPLTYDKPLPAQDLVHETVLQEAKDGIAQHGILEPPAFAHKLPEGLSVPLDSKAEHHRRFEVGELKKASAAGSHSLMRFNLYNLGGLNSLFGNDKVDEALLRPIEKAIEAAIDKHMPDVKRRFFKRGGAEYDLLIETQDEKKMQAVKTEVQDTLSTEIFGRQIEDILDQHDVPLDETKYSGEASLYNLPQKKHGLDGAGLTMTTVAIDQGAHYLELFQDLDGQRRVQEYHGTAYVEQSSDSEELNLCRIGRPSQPGRVIAERSLETDKHAVPHVWSLADNLGGGQVKEIFDKPVGLIYEALTGISLQPVLNRQQAILKLIDRGVFAEEIEQHLTSEADFDTFVKSKIADEKIDSIDMSRRALTRVMEYPQFLTFNLAEKLGYVPPALDGITNAALKVQAAVRAGREIESYATQFVAGNSRDVLPELLGRSDKILEDAHDKGTSLERAQLANHSIKILKHEMSLNEELPDREVIAAGYSLVQAAYNDAADDFRHMGLPKLGDTIEKMGRAYKARSMDVDEAIALLQGRVNETKNSLVQGQKGVKKAGAGKRKGAFQPA